MPELPEVETIKNELAPWVVGQSFTQVNILDTELVCGCSAEEVRRGLIGRKVESLERRGKYLIFHLSNGRSLIIHLRMTGTLLLNHRGVDRYARAVFHLSNGHRLVFSDLRRLGLIWLVDDAVYPGHPGAETKPASHPHKSRASRPVYRRRNRQYVCR